MIAQGEFRAALARDYPGVAQGREVGFPAEEENVRPAPTGRAFNVAPEPLDHFVRPGRKVPGLRGHAPVQIDATEPPAIHLGQRGEHDAYAEVASSLTPPAGVLGAFLGGFPCPPSVRAIGLRCAARGRVHRHFPPVAVLLPRHPDRSVLQFAQGKGGLASIWGFVVFRYRVLHDLLRFCRTTRVPFG